MPRAGNRRVHLYTPSVPNTLAGLRGRRTASFRRVAPGYVGPCEESSEHVCTSRKRRYLMASTLDRFEITIDQPDVARFASHFELDAVYHGPFGSYRGRSAIREMSAAHHASGSMVGKRRMNRPCPGHRRCRRGGGLLALVDRRDPRGPGGVLDGH